MDGKDEQELFNVLSETKASFILSTWHHNEFRDNEMIARYWNRFNILTQEHFYHSGGHIENRHSIIEALVFNFELTEKLILSLSVLFSMIYLKVNLTKYYK